MISNSQINEEVTDSLIEADISQLNITKDV